ncbi:MAG: M23 family metallopeptidase [Clostridia bacterium]|nr:M23 family metallopeptidase [Clostridia bacterium]
MAIDPATAKAIAKVVISQITDEEKRQRLIIAVIIFIVVTLLIIMLPLFLLTSTIDNIKSALGFKDETDKNYGTILEIRTEYNKDLTSNELVFNGTLPMPVNGATVTSEFGSRIHPVTGKKSFHTGIDLAGVWHSDIMAVLDGTVVFAGVQSGYGNCIEIEHNKDGEIFYTLYGHLARIDVSKGQEIKQGNVIAIQGGDPKRDPNPRIFNRNTFTF